MIVLEVLIMDEITLTLRETELAVIGSALLEHQDGIECQVNWKYREMVLLLIDKIDEALRRMA